MVIRSLVVASALLLLMGPACTDSSDEAGSSTESSDATSDATTSESGDETTTSEATTTTAETGETTGETGDETTTGGPEFPPGCELPEPDAGFMAWCGPDDPVCAEGHGCYLFGGTRGVCSVSCETDADCAWGADDMCSDEIFACVEANSGLKRCLIPCASDEDCFAGSSCVPPFAVCLPDEP